ncbi:MAG: serine/threonine protein kinase [Gemmataceae bacterium]|nr:serine/threonine protein kinase [Gemmataceae bacterium]
MDSATLITQLRDLDLWPEDETVQRRALGLSRRHEQARAFARELIQLGLLTPYQANQLLTGRGPSLAVGPYRILERLGEGGVGQVFKARHRLLHRVVALKLIRPERVTHPTTVGRFQREVQAAAQLDHPNVVRAYDAHEEAGTYYFAMQYVEGADLNRLVKERGPLSVAQACHCIAQAARGLQHIHQNGLVHRDVKPGNLMVTGGSSGGTVKILDLGLARLNESPEEGAERRPALTQLGMVVGTYDYMAPEQARDSRLADARSDLYSLGCTFYFLLTGRPPFPEGGALEKMMHHQLDEPAPVESLRSGVAPEVLAILRKLMAKRPEDRYQIAAEAADALTPFCAEAPAVVWMASAAVAAEVGVDGGDNLEPLVVLSRDTLPGGHAASPWLWVSATFAVAAVGVLVLVLFRLGLF